MKYLKKFENHSAYEAAESSLILPNVSLCSQEYEVHYNPSSSNETRLVVKFNVTDTSNPTIIASATTNISSIEIDGVEQSTVESTYTFSTTGEHTVKYTLVDPTSLSDYVLYQCYNATSIDIPNSVTSIGASSFAYCTSLTSITIPSSVTSIGNNSFWGCSSLTSIVIPSGVTTINGSTFQDCEGLTSVTIPDGVTSIGIQAFQNCAKLTSIVIPSGVTTINGSTFRECSKLTSVTIPDGVTSIGNYAFYYCTSLTSIDIPSGVTNIGFNSFRDCSKLASVTVEATTPPTLGNNSFNGNASGRKIYVPSGSVDTYKAASNWSTYASDIEAIS